MDPQPQIDLLNQQMRRHAHDDQESLRIIPVQNGHNNQFLQTTGSMLQWASTTGAGATPAGNNKDIQFNDAGAFGGDDSFQFDKSTKTLLLNKPDDEFDFVGQSGSGNQDGTAIVLISGGGAGTGAGGNVNLAASNGRDGGDIELTAGGGTRNGGVVIIFGGNAGTGTGGEAQLAGGNSTSGSGGNLNLSSGNGVTGGSINVQSGASSSTGQGGDITILGGSGGPTSGRGANVIIAPGVGLSSTNDASGETKLLTGGGGTLITTTATTGFLRIPVMAGTPTGVPTDTDGACILFDVNANKLWINGNTGNGWKSIALT